MAHKEPQLAQPAFDSAKLYLWVKGLETKVNNLLQEVDVIKNDFMSKHNNLKKELKAFNSDLLELKHEEQKTQQKMDLIIKELKNTAGMEDVMTLKKYMEFWNPMNFVSQRDLERVVEMKVAAIKSTVRKQARTKRKNTAKKHVKHAKKSVNKNVKKKKK